MNGGDIELSIDGKIGRITLCKEDKLNVMSGRTMDELKEAVDRVCAEPEVRVVVLEGRGKAFCAGADISWFMSTPAPEILEKVRQLQETLLKLELSDKVSIASIRGACLGGGSELALACDIRIATPNAVFGQPEINFGIIPGAGGSQRLPRIIGDGPARELILTGRIIGSDEAYRLGIVSRVVNGDDLENQVLILAREIALKAPGTAAAAKRAIVRGFGKDPEVSMLIEIDEFRHVVSLEGAQKGFEAFVRDKKIPYKGEWK